MSQVITNAFEQYWQSSLAAEQPVVLDEFILADIPNLDITSPIDPDTGLPPESQIVHRQNVDQRGRINNNAVAYTIVMDTTVGNFSFNAMYLRNKQNGVIGMIVYKGRETKLKTDQTTGQTGNSLVKSMLMGYDQAAEATLTNVDAGTWQIDYAARLRGMDEDIRQLQADLYGHHTFVGDGFKVVETDGAFQVTPGVAIVGGLRVELKQPEVIYPGTTPISVWVDVHRAGSLLSEHQNHFTIITSVADLADHVDSNGYQHYVAKLATVQSDSTVVDGRSSGDNNGMIGVREAVVPEKFLHYGDDYMSMAADYCRENGIALHIPRNKTYKINKRVVFDRITLLWEGVIEVVAAIDMPVVFRRQVTMPTYGYLKTERGLLFPDDFFMVGFYSAAEGEQRSFGCTDNVISGRLDIRNGNIDYSINDQGVPDSIDKLTGGGVIMLAGSWNRESTGINKKSYEFVHKNNINVFVDGFSKPFVIQAMLDKDDPNADISKVWANGNEVNVKARRAKECVQLLTPLARPNGLIGAEVSGNFITAELQRSEGLTQKYLYCQGRGNKILMKGWDAKKEDGNLIVFERGNNLEPGMAEPSGNIVELLQGTLPDSSESDYSAHVYEQTPGLNSFIAPNPRFDKMMPEETPFSNSSRQTASYTAKVDNFLAGLVSNPGNSVVIYKNGQVINMPDVENMFDFNPESVCRITAGKLDYIEVAITLKSGINHFCYIGQSLGYISKGFGGRVLIELKNSNGEVVYSLSQNLRPTNISGYIDAPNIKYIKFTFRDFQNDGELRLSSLYGKVYNKPTSSGIVTMHGCKNVVGDICFEDPSKGFVVRDRVTGKRLRIVVSNGVIGFEDYVY